VYDLVAPKWDAANYKPYKDPNFVLDPNPANWQGSTPADSTRRWDACLRSQRFDVERYTWDSSRTQFVRGARQDAALVRRRIDGMPRYVFDGTQRADVKPRADAMLRFNQARAPRPLAALRVEENRGLPTDPAHAVARHVMGYGPGIRNERDLAWRAAFGQVPGDMHAPTGGDPASAFRSEASANSTAQQLHAELTRDWVSQHRNTLANNRQVTLRTRVDGRRVLAFRGRPPPTPPAYLRHRMRVFWAAHPGAWTGNRALFAGDENSAEGRAWIARGNTFNTADPLTDPVPMAGKTAVMYVKATATPRAAGGWFIKSMFPQA
jgi:hypothetical protein